MKPRLLDNSEICLLSTCIYNNKYSQYVVDDIIFGISLPDYPRIAVETTCIGQYINMISASVYSLTRTNTHKLSFNNIELIDLFPPFSLSGLLFVCMNVSKHFDTCLYIELILCNNLGYNSGVI